jgi:hypothetical protein
MLAVASDFGNYVYHWPRAGWGESDFRKFLSRCHDDYLIGKLGAGRRVLDESRTRTNIRDHILSCRRNGPWQRDFARREWDLLRASEFENEVQAYEWYVETGIDDPGEFLIYSPEPQLVAFVRKVWPRLQAKLREALAVEAA